MLDDTKLAIAKMTLEEAYTLYKCLHAENDQDATMVRYGVKIYFDMDGLFSQTTHIITKPKRGTIKIGYKTYKLNDFHTELNTRERIIKKYLLDNTSTIELTTPRGLT